VWSSDVNLRLISILLSYRYHPSALHLTTAAAVGSLNLSVDDSGRSGSSREESVTVTPSTLLTPHTVTQQHKLHSISSPFYPTASSVCVRLCQPSTPTSVCGEVVFTVSRFTSKECVPVSFTWLQTHAALHSLLARFDVQTLTQRESGPAMIQLSPRLLFHLRDQSVHKTVSAITHHFFNTRSL